VAGEKVTTEAVLCEKLQHGDHCAVICVKSMLPRMCCATFHQWCKVVVTCEQKRQLGSSCVGIAPLQLETICVCCIRCWRGNLLLLLLLMLPPLLLLLLLAGWW
jgi:hypothetical protein